jgi:hypothetical protein
MIVCLLSHLGPCNSHRETNVSCLEWEPIVCSLSGDADNIAAFLEHPDQDSPILRRGNGFHDVRREHTEVWSFHDNTSSCLDVTLLLGNRPGGERVV